MANFNLRLQAYQANFSDKEKELAQFLLKKSGPNYPTYDI